MKLFHPDCALRALALAFALVGCGIASAQDAIGTVKRVEGTPVAASVTGERALQVGSSVYVGEQVVTRRGGAVGITLQDGTQLAVGPNSNVAVRTFQFDSTTREGSLLVDISKGALRMVSGFIAKANPSKVGVNTPTATIGIRGTDFVVDLGDEAQQ